jgi:thiol-disulfide isomerase/thioredoxin
MSKPVVVFMNMSFLKSRVLVLAFALATIAANVLAAELKVGESVPDLSKFKLEGNLPDLKGRVVLIDFWASWCGPCKKSFPVMKDLQNKFDARGFSILAISVDEDKSAMNGFLKKNPVPFEIVRDAKGKTPEAFGVDKMPTSFLVGADGKIIAVHSGFDGEATRKQYLAEIEAALKAAGK